MYYVEFLRVFRALRTCAIVLGGIFLIAIAIRLWSGQTLHEQFMKNFSPTAVRTVTNANGVETVTIEDPAKAMRAVQHTRRGEWDLTIYQQPTAARRAAHDASRHHHESSEMQGIIQVREFTLPSGVYVTEIRNDRRIPFEIIAYIAAFCAAIFATIIGASLSRENAGHLELVWTKPSSRERTGLTMFSVDIAGILVTLGLVALLVYCIVALFLGWPQVTFRSGSGVTLALALLFPIAWYALAQGLTASLTRAGGIVCGLLWVPALMLPSLLVLHNDAVRLVIRTIDTLNPFAYFGDFNMPGVPGPTLLPATHTANILALCAIIIIAGAASLMQWRRLEA